MTEITVEPLVRETTTAHDPLTDEAPRDLSGFELWGLS